MVFLLSWDYPFAKSLVLVLIPEDLLRKGKALERKSNKNYGTANKKQPLPNFCLETILEYSYIILLKLPKTIQSEAESKYRKLQPKQLRLDEQTCN